MQNIFISQITSFYLLKVLNNIQILGPHLVLDFFPFFPIVVFIHLFVIIIPITSSVDSIDN